MFKVILYNNSAEKNRLNKFNFLRTIGIIEGTLRETTSILSPEITFKITSELSFEDNEFIDIVDNDNIDVLSDNNEVVYSDYNNSIAIFSANYAYIPAFKRYYYVTNISSLSEHLWRLSFEVDVLMSYISQINNTKCFVSRNEFDYDSSLPDNKLPFRNGFSTHFVRSTERCNTLLTNYYGGQNVRNIVMVVCGNCPQNELKLLDTASGASFVPVYGDEYYVASDINNFNKVYLLTSDIYNRICNRIAGGVIHWFGADPSQSITKILRYPLDFFNIGSSFAMRYQNPIRIGTTDIDQWIKIDDIEDVPTEDLYKPALILHNKIFTFLVGSFDYTPYPDSVFLSHSPYINAQIYLPFYGCLDLDIDLFNIDGRIRFDVFYEIDFLSGSCVARFIKRPTDEVLYSFEFEISLEMPVGQTNASDVRRNKLLAVGTVAAAIVTKGASLAAEAGNLEYLKWSAASRGKHLTPSSGILHQVASAERDLSVHTTQASINIASNFTSDFLVNNQVRYVGGVVNDSILKGINIDTSVNPDHPEAILIIKSMIPKYNNSSELNEYAHLVGRPCQIVDEIRNLRGYTEVSGVHLEGFSEATPQELDAIETALKSGVLLPE